MVKLSLRPSAKTVVSLAVILGLVIAAGGFLCAMQTKELGSLSRELESKKARLIDEKDLSERLELALADLEESKRELAHLEDGVIEPDYIPTLLIQLDDLARASGLSVEGVKVEEAKETAPPSPPKKGSEDVPEGAERGLSRGPTAQAAAFPYEEKILSVDVKGGFERIVEFVRRLTEFPKIVSVAEMKIAPSTDRMTGGDPALNVTISLHTYMWQESKPSEKGG